MRLTLSRDGNMSACSAILPLFASSTAFIHKLASQCFVQWILRDLFFQSTFLFWWKKKKCLQIKVTGHLSCVWFFSIFFKYMFSLYQTFVCMNLLILPSLFNRWVWGVIHFLLEIWYCKGLVFTVIDNRHVQPLAVLCTVRFDCTNSILM